MQLDYKKYAALERRAAAEGCILLRNEADTLPLRSGETVALFGRMQKDSYYCGTGSGGRVNPPYVVSILEGIRNQCAVDAMLADTYQKWIQAHPFDRGIGWAQEPWSQEEMPVSEELARQASRNATAAVVVIGRTAGEDRDSTPVRGSYYLSEIEENMLETVCAAFSRVAVVLNVGSMMDLSWIERIAPGAVLIAWPGGCETGNAVASVLTGSIAPSGHLPDTAARWLSDYPSDSAFGSEEENIYSEDIYVGYRYFETFAAEDVLYPFGFGLSYTRFECKAGLCCVEKEKVRLEFYVTNIGKAAGRYVVQVYLGAPQGMLGKPKRVLVGFQKTTLLEPGETDRLQFLLSKTAFASYDDSSVSGFPCAWVLEKGEYVIYAGDNVRDARRICAWKEKETQLVQQLRQTMAPLMPFARFHPEINPDGSCKAAWESVEPVRAHRWRTAGIGDTVQPCVGDQGYRWTDVRDGRVSLDTFLVQLTDSELVCLCRGEGMCSPKVTPGTAGAFGGVTDALRRYGFPIACCADGPAGIRMDCGTMAFCLPVGTALASTFDPSLVRDLFSMVGMELLKNRIDTILGPGVNIHRHPLCGRNFEYFSEDPFLAGVMASAELSGMQSHGVTGTVKHLACNNQEYHRSKVNAVLSERALREVYLRPFELAVKLGRARSLMTSYNPVNGVWSASNWEMLTQVLRTEWGFDGVVMTDWWADMNEPGRPATRTNIASMLRAQNDLYMVTENAARNTTEDNAEAALGCGELSRAELLRSARNICSFLMRSPCSANPHPAETLEVLHEPKCRRETALCRQIDAKSLPVTLPAGKSSMPRGTDLEYHLYFADAGSYRIRYQFSCSEAELSQLPVTIECDGRPIGTLTLHGTVGISGGLPFFVDSSQQTILHFYFGESGIQIQELVVDKA